ncbi:endoplasmic reticulum membrane-associated RNA degradation protein isoform X5 [Ascaphus truei]|uniref:endoplasmic reticulum membrane-associated RNA degradation protein isoform X5 n=1 Tax=Ascaphus truei TaxID=8439 RepID=UPI003F59533D
MREGDSGTPQQCGSVRMLETFPVTTCLSPTVHHMVCNLGFEIEVSYDIRRVLCEDNRVCWKTLSDTISYIASGERLDYVQSVRLLGPLCEAVHTHLSSLSSDVFKEQFGWCFYWTNNAELFLSTLAVLQSLDGTQISLSLMKVTSCLERSLGDVYLMIGKDCPFLLRDLLASAELAEVFSPPVMDVLRVFLGSPESLNLRNILWHGFASPYEIPPKYCSMLILLTAGLGQLLKTYLAQTASSLEHRPYFVFHDLQELHVFPDLNDEALSLAEKLVNKSTFVLQHMTPFWTEAIIAFRQGRYANCAILLLPQLETGLRLIFTTVNKCPHRMLTAESSSLYTTFDEVLAKQLNSDSDNQVPLTLGEPAMVLDCSESLQRWTLLHSPPLDHSQQVPGLEDMAEFSHETAHILGLLPFQEDVDSLHSEDLDSWLLTDKWINTMTELCSKRIRTLYCHRWVLEAVGVLRKVSTQCHLVSNNIISASELRFEQWLSKTLRSRQRQNYLRMLSSIQVLSPILRLVMTLVTGDLHNIHRILEMTPSEYQEYLKHIKLVLQYTENLAIYTSLEKNRWDESIELTRRILLKIRLFYEKHKSSHIIKDSHP